jgi:hypothetical protein
VTTLTTGPVGADTVAASAAGARSVLTGPSAEGGGLLPSEAKLTLGQLEQAERVRAAQESASFGGGVAGSSSSSAAAAAVDRRQKRWAFELEGWWHGETWFNSGNHHGRCGHSCGLSAAATACCLGGCVWERQRCWCVTCDGRCVWAGGGGAAPPHKSPGSRTMQLRRVAAPAPHDQRERAASHRRGWSAARLALASRAAEEHGGEVTRHYEGEGWDDTGAFRVSGGVEFDGVSGEQFWMLRCSYVTTTM